MSVQKSHLDHLLRHGYVVIPDFLSSDELQAARENFLRYYPTWEELESTPQRYGGLFDEAESLQTEFPFAGDALNDISTHPRIIALVEQLLGTSDILLSQSAIWAKYAGAADYEQGLHLDYQGNTLVVPRDDGDYRQVNMILYYSEVTEDLGPTCIVSQEHTKDAGLWPPFRIRRKYPDLYAKEIPILATPGSLLVFSMRTFHRASSIAADEGARFSHHMVWRSGKHNFQGYHHWPRFGEKPELQSFIERATPRQREVLGFPEPGNPYWTEETLIAVAARYPRMDMKPYRSQT